MLIYSSVLVWICPLILRGLSWCGNLVEVFSDIGSWAITGARGWHTATKSHNKNALGKKSSFEENIRWRKRCVNDAYLQNFRISGKTSNDVKTGFPWHIWNFHGLDFEFCSVSDLDSCWLCPRWCRPSLSVCGLLPANSFVPATQATGGRGAAQHHSCPTRQSSYRGKASPGRLPPGVVQTRSPLSISGYIVSTGHQNIKNTTMADKPIYIHHTTVIADLQHAQLLAFSLSPMPQCHSINSHHSSHWT